MLVYLRGGEGRAEMSVLLISPCPHNKVRRTPNNVTRVVLIKINGHTDLTA